MSHELLKGTTDHKSLAEGADYNHTVVAPSPWFGLDEKRKERRSAVF